MYMHLYAAEKRMKNEMSPKIVEIPEPINVKLQKVPKRKYC